MSIRLNGIDVALYQGDIDWKQVYGAGVYFAMIKCSQGCSIKESVGSFKPFVDPKFEQNITNAFAAGIKCGVYHYPTCTTADQAAAEADYLLSVLEPHREKITFPVAIDIEEARYQKTALKTQNTRFVRIVADKIRAAGYIPVLYSNRYFLNMYLDLKSLSDLDLWLAVYFSPRRIDPAPSFQNMTMWQWTASGVRIPGINADVDCNIAFKDYAAPLKNDLNRDVVIDSVDALIHKRYLLGNLVFAEQQKKPADLYDDGDVDSMDYLLFRRKIVAAAK